MNRKKREQQIEEQLRAFGEKEMGEMKLPESLQPDRIREKILELLREEQVIHWYRNREPADAFQKRMNALVVAGEVEKALQHYTKKVAQKQRWQYIRNVWDCIKNNLRMLRNKLLGR